MSSLHLILSRCQLLAFVTVRLEEDLWQERFPNHHKVVDALRQLGHSIRFGVDAKQAHVSKWTHLCKTGIGLAQSPNDPDRSTLQTTR